MKRPGCTIIGTVVAKPEKREELYRILIAQVAPTRAEEGCVSYDFHCDKADPNVFLFYENFVNRDALPHGSRRKQRQGTCTASTSARTSAPRTSQMGCERPPF